MKRLIDAVYENGVFRPVRPIVLADNQRVQLSLDDSVFQSVPGSELTEAPQRHMPPPFPEEDSIINDEPYVNPPHRIVGTAWVHFIDAGRHLPPTLPLDEE